MTDELSAAVGRETTADDVLAPRLVAGLRATLGHRDFDDPFRPAPQAAHFMLAPPIAPMAVLGRDGHPALGGFLPKVALPRRMWAASRMTFHRPLWIGDTVTRTSTVLTVRETVGGTGPLVFVEVGHVLSVRGEVAVEEVQTLVFREDGAPARAPAADGGVSRDWPLARVVTPSPVLLFRYSALTFNGHRIHYDAPYATGVEGYEGLVVHGPLVATLLADLVAAVRGDDALARFSFRARSPAVADRPLRLAGRIDGRSVELRAVGEDDRIVMTAEGELA